MEKAQKVRKRFTFAPEAGTQRLRDVINKGLHRMILQALLNCIRGRMEQCKTVFYDGLPTETEEDIEGIANLQKKLLMYTITPRGKRGQKD